MRFSMVLAVLVLAASAWVGVFSDWRVSFDSDSIETNTPVSANASKALPQTINAPVSLGTPTSVSTVTPQISNASTTGNVTSRASVSPGLNASTLTPAPINVSTESVPPRLPNNASTATVSPTSANVSTGLTPLMPTNVPCVPISLTPENTSTTSVLPRLSNVSQSSTPSHMPINSPINTAQTTTQQLSKQPSTEPSVSVVSSVPATTNVYTPQNGSHLTNLVTQPQNSSVPLANTTMPNPQQSDNPSEAMSELVKNLEMLTRLYTQVPGVGYMNDASEGEEKNDVHWEREKDANGVLEEMKMCMLSTIVGEERGSLSLMMLVTAEDEERMRVDGSFYQVSKEYPDKQRAFTSFCGGKGISFLSFNSIRN